MRQGKEPSKGQKEMGHETRRQGQGSTTQMFVKEHVTHNQLAEWGK